MRIQRHIMSIGSATEVDDYVSGACAYLHEVLNTHGFGRLRSSRKNPLGKDRLAGWLAAGWFVGWPPVIWTSQRDLALGPLNITSQHDLAT